MRRAIAVTTAFALGAGLILTAPAQATSGGSVFTGYAPGAELNGVVYASVPITVAGQQRYIVGGSFTDAGSAGNDSITILNSDGSVYPGFSPAGTLNGAVSAIVPITVSGQPKYLITGGFTDVGAADNDYVTILNSDGTVYTGFSPGNRLTSVATGAAVTTVGGALKYVVSGDFTNAGGSGNNRIVMFNSNGTVDTSFSPAATLNSTVRKVVAVTIGGQTKYFIGGNFTNAGAANNDYLAALNANGSVYSGFSPGATLDSPVLSITATTISGSLKLLVGGQFADAGSVDTDRLALFNATGSVDSSLACRNTFGIGDVYAATPYSVGGELKFVVAGSFSNVGTAHNNYVTMLNRDCSIYRGFTPGSTLNFAALNVAVTRVAGRDRVLLGGLFSNVGTPHNVASTMLDLPVIDRPNPVSSARVTGSLRAGVRTLRWNAPAGISVTRPVSSYRITVQRAGRARPIYDASIAGSRVSFPLRKNRLLAGAGSTSQLFIARIYATNSAGSSTAAVVRFRSRR